MKNPDIMNLLIGNRSQYEIIPLGVNCEISHYLRSRGLRLTALPFDWNITPIQSAIDLLKNGFSGFLERDNLINLQPTQRMLFDENGIALKIKNDIITPIVCKKYNMLFPHDFPYDFEKSIPIVREKYKNRIERLTALLNSGKHLIFVQHDEELNGWQKYQYKMALNSSFSNRIKGWELSLSTFLDEYYPNLNYSLTNLEYFKSVLSK